MSTNENRDERNGQYSHNMDRMCKCGRTKGKHTAHAPYSFEAWETEEGNEGPECDKFRAAKKK